jgi:glycosyltransferase involved in cell wall biosynthesis
MILNAGFPPDIRIEKEVETLLSSHSVTLLCTKRSGEPETESFSGLRVTRIFSGIERRLASYQLMTTCYSDGWKKEINQFIQKNQLDALHVHDLPLAGTALEAARSHRIPIVLDLHEDYPAMLAEIQRIPWSRVPSVGVLGLRLASVPRWREYEQKVVREVDAVIAVVDEAGARVRDLGVQSSKIHLVQNYVPGLQRAKSDQITDDKTVTAVYIGGFDQARDLQTVMDAAGLLADRGCDHLRILLVGGSKRDIALLRNYASRKRLAVNNVSFHEWMDRDDAERILDEAHIGLVPHVKSAHTDSTIPHKLFQYMARRLPVVASNCVPLQRIVTDAACGVVYESGNAESLAGCLEELYRNPDKRMRMGNAGLSTVNTTCNWSLAGANLLNVYRQLEITAAGA